MFLMRAFLDPNSRAAKNDRSNPEGLHKTVMRAFPKTESPSPRAAHSVLHRLDAEHENQWTLLVQSRTKPALDQWPKGYLLPESSEDFFVPSGRAMNPAVREISNEHAAIVPGVSFAFRLKANTTRKIDTKTGADGVRRNGRRVPVRGDEARLQWLNRHAEAGGFSVDPERVRITEVPTLGGRGVSAVTVAGSLFDGMLVVHDADRFRSALQSGVGPGKAYGYGLLSIARFR